MDEGEKAVFLFYTPQNQSN